MNDDEETIGYGVTLTGDQWDHEHFRETVHEVGGELELEAEGGVPTYWTEVSINDDGIGVTLYSQTHPDDEPNVVDETWLTHDELSEPMTPRIVLDSEQHAN